MSLATRCNTCGTIFRVAQDQLAISEGWVRCGRCSEVFNALEGLFDLNRELPPEWSPGLQQSADATGDAPSGPPAPQDGERPYAAGPPHIDEPLSATAFGTSFGKAGSTPAARVNERDRLEFPDARFDPDVLRDDPDAISGYQATVLQEIAPGLLAGPDTPPDFVRRAQRAQRWHSPQRRAALGVLAVALAGALALQAAHHWRDTVAVRWPATRAALVAWCGFAHCALQAPRSIDDLSVENTALEQAGEPETFKLTVALRNHGSMLLALPSVDLSLTDPAGELVVRRVLGPTDFHVASAVIPAGAETSLQLVLRATDAKVAGYTVEIFYP